MPVSIDRAEIKSEAKTLLRTAQVSPIRFTLFFLAIDLVLNEISTVVDYMLGDTVGAASLPFSFVSILVALLSTVLLAGYACYCLGIQRGETMPYDSLFDAFPFAGKIVLLYLLMGLLTGLASMLFVVPGIVLALSYSLALFHLCDEPDLGVVEAMRRSRWEMRGYKWQLFLLLLSFWPLLLAAALVVGLFEFFLLDFFPATLGGDLLATLVFGVLEGSVTAYLLPYLRFASVGFYRRVTAPPEDPTRDVIL